jgi:DNA polymerase-3 subunit beta
MKFRVERDVLADAVTWAARTLPTRPPVPVLAGIQIEAGNGILRLSSYDYDVSTRIEISADISEDGTALVSGRLLADIARALPAKPVDIEVVGMKAVITCGASRFTMAIMPIAEYPELPAMPTVIGSIDGPTFVEAVNQVTVAASKDETLPLLTGVRMEIEGEKVTFLATDRYRLALRDINWVPVRPDISEAALVRARTLSDAAKSLGSSDVTTALSVGEGVGLIGFEAGGRHTTSGLLDGDYPAVRKLFPESTPIHAVMNVEELSQAARRVALVAERNAPIRLSFTQGQVLLQAGAGDDAQASEEIEANLVGEDIQVAFNPNFLLDGVGAMTTEFIRLAFTQPSKPVEFTGQTTIEGEDDRSYRYLLVPIRFAG